MKFIRHFVIFITLTGLSLSMFSQVIPWWQDRVFYEIFVRSFYDSNGDGIGDINGLRQKLDYLNDGDPLTQTDLGITGIWLMPISPSPSYHGYDVTDYRGINPQYGSMAEFQSFLSEAHARGIKVIVDFVLNHCSNQHPWFLSAASNPASPYYDWFRWSATNPGYTGPWGQQVWHYQPSIGQYYFGLFWSGMPDLNYHNVQAKAEMFDIASYWIDSIGVDGFRLDAVKHIFEDSTIMQNLPETFTFLQDFRMVVKAAGNNSLLVGEVWDETSAVLPYVSPNRLDMCFEFDFASEVLSALSSGNATMLQLKAQEVTNSYGPGKFATFLTNHDQNRLLEQLGGDLDKNRVAASIYLTFPGTPFLYYGEEIGMYGSGPDEFKRRPMQWTAGTNGGFTTGTPWEPLNVNYTFFNVDNQQGDPGSLWGGYRSLIHLRNQHTALQYGDIRMLTSVDSRIFGFLRSWNGEHFLSVHNVSGDDVSAYDLSLATSQLQQGNLSVNYVFGSATFLPLPVNAMGGFSGWKPLETIPGHTSLVMKTGTPTGLEDQEFNPDLQVFPVPAKDFLIIDLPDKGTYRLSLVSSEGKLALTQEAKGETRLDLRALSQGLWVLEIEQNGKRISRKVPVLR